MKHVNLSKNQWEWNPDRGEFVCRLNFGSHLQDEVHLPVVGITPVTHHFVSFKDQELYYGPDKDEAGRIRDEFNAPIRASGSWEIATRRKAGLALPMDCFQLEGKQLIAGEDHSDYCLLFVGCNAGFRGGVELCQTTTAEILRICQAGRESSGARCEVAAILKPGETVVFNTWGRGQNDTVVFIWDGKVVKEERWPAE